MMFNLMNELSELIYVVDLESYELLYMNRAGKALFGVDSLAGRKCYQVIQGFDRPCPHCNNALLSENAFYTWEYLNPKVGRHYLLKDRIVEWEGKRARAEIAFDMTEKEEQRRRLQATLGMENVVTQCAKKLCDTDEDASAVDAVLALAGEYLRSDRVYIFEVDGEYMRNTHEWCAPGVEAQIHNLQEMPLSLIERWKSAFAHQERVVVPDVETLRETSPEEYQTLKSQNIHSLIAAPLVLKEKLFGYIGIDNYDPPMEENAAAMLTSVNYFIASALRHQQALEALEHMSCHDSLTGLANRNGFIQETEGRHRLPLGVVYVDINGIKEINDQYGHEQGDCILVDAARCISELFSGSGCYRVGGDEFVIICQGISRTDFSWKVQSLKSAFACKETYSASVGSNWSEQSVDLQELLRSADEQMYEDKKEHYRGSALSARYRHHIDDVLNLTAPGVLDRLLASGCFQVLYQPKFSVKTGEPTGAEALSRLVLPQQNVCSPDLFIPILEEARLISALDFYVFEQVCKRQRLWRDRGLKVVPVSTNFSRRTLAVGGFAARLESICERAGVSKSLMEVEVTETVDTDDKRLFYSVLERLKRRRFRISIDDFGVRNANLLLLTDVDFDVLKIDKSLTDSLCKNARTRQLISSLISICHEMGVRVIAEGVELEEQAALLREADCDDIQGYLYSRPISDTEFELRYLAE